MTFRYSTFYFHFALEMYEKEKKGKKLSQKSIINDIRTEQSKEDK